MNVFWVLNNFDVSVASTRYRCLIPIFESSQSKSEINHFVIQNRFLSLKFLKKDFVVFVKAFKRRDFLLAKKLKTQGALIIFDVCDNILDGPFDDETKHNFRSMLLEADRITVPTQALRDFFLEELDLVDEGKIIVICDPMEEIEHVKFSKSYFSYRSFKDFSEHKCISFFLVSILDRFFDKVLRLLNNAIYNYIEYCVKFLSNKEREMILETVDGYNVRHFSIKTKILLLPIFFPLLFVKYNFSESNIFLRNLILKVVNDEFDGRQKDNIIKYKKSDDSEIKLLWFGNSGAHGIFGMSDLLIIKDELEQIQHQYSISLTVISNNYDHFLELKKSFSIPLYYASWTPDIVYNIAQEFDCVVLPNPLNQYSLGKSANRSLLSLCLGLPVVATKTKDLEKLTNCLFFNDWEESIINAKFNTFLVKEKLENFKSLKKNNPHNPKFVWLRWSELFSSAYR